MKYKILKSVAHNFSHSFLSYMNYIDGGYVVDDVLQLAREANGERISFHWIPESAAQKNWPRRVLKSIANYREWLPNHIQASGADIEKIREFRTDVFLNAKKQIAVEAYIVDDRGQQHFSKVFL